MNQQTTTGTGTSDMLVMKWVKDTQVGELVDAADDFNVQVALASGLLAASVAAGVALAAGALHPLWLYIILSAGVSCGLYASVMAFRERRKVNKVRQTIREEAESYYFPSPFRQQLNLSTGLNESPTLTVGEAGRAQEINATGIEVTIAEQGADGGTDSDSGVSEGQNS